MDYEFSVGFFQVIRLAVAWIIIQFFISLTNVYTGTFVGFLATLGLKLIFEQFMMIVFNCESMGAFDAVYFLDDDKNYSNVLGPTFFNKFDFEGMREYLFRKTENIHKCRSKVVQKFGLNWY